MLCFFPALPNDAQWLNLAVLAERRSHRKRFTVVRFRSRYNVAPTGVNNNYTKILVFFNYVDVTVAKGTTRETKPEPKILKSDEKETHCAKILLFNEYGSKSSGSKIYLLPGGACIKRSASTVGGCKDGVGGVRTCWCSGSRFFPLHFFAMKVYLCDAAFRLRWLAHIAGRGSEHFFSPKCFFLLRDGNCGDLCGKPVLDDPAYMRIFARVLSRWPLQTRIFGSNFTDVVLRYPCLPYLMEKCPRNFNLNFIDLVIGFT